MAEEQKDVAEPSSSEVPEQKVLSEPDVSPIDPNDAPLQAPGSSRERSASNSTRRSGHYDTQRLEKRPSSVSNRSKGKGKRVTVDFREPHADDEIRAPVSPIESEAGDKRPGSARDDAYTNFSRSDAAIRRNNSNRSGKQPASGSTSNTNLNNGMSSLPTHLEADDPSSHAAQAGSEEPVKEDINALPTHPEDDVRPQAKQNRLSAMSTGSRRLRPPVHQSDLEAALAANSSEESAPIPPFSQSISGEDAERTYKDLPPQASPALRELYTISHLIFFSFLGTLARTGIEWLTFYPGAIIITPIVWANFAGSLTMGFLTEDVKMFKDEWAEPLATSRTEKRMSRTSRMSRQSRLSVRTSMSQDFERFQKRERARIKKTIPLYTGITTGFCGCFTSFSIFARDMFLALSNDTPSLINHPALPSDGAAAISASQSLPRNGGYSFMAVTAVIIITLALSIIGFVVGQQLALLAENVTPRIPTRFTRLILDRLMVVLGFGCWLGAIFLLIWPPDRPGGPVSAGSWANETWRGIELFSMVFCPLGCLLRYYASKWMNEWEPSFPLGTFAVNMLGTAIVAMCYDIQHIGVGDGDIGGGLLGCQALEGVIDGFTGCLTTVSTFAAEICALRRKYAWRYAFSSVAGSLCLVVVIMGSIRWTVGFSEPACITSYVNKY